MKKITTFEKHLDKQYGKKGTDRRDKFDCVEMKHKAARTISQKLLKMTREEELTYWREKTKHFHRRKSISKHKLTKV